MMHTGADLRAQCTEDELARMTASQRFPASDAETLTLIVEHPTRLHRQFVEANQAHWGWTVGESVDLGDGFVRTVMTMPYPPRRKTGTSRLEERVERPHDQQQHEEPEHRTGHRRTPPRRSQIKRPRQRNSLADTDPHRHDATPNGPEHNGM